MLPLILLVVCTCVHVLVALPIHDNDPFVDFFDPDSALQLEPAQYAYHHHHIHARSPNDDRSLGFKGDKKKDKSKNKRTYPWDQKGPQENKVRLTYPASVLKHEAKDEDPWPSDYYDEYEFEFAKGMVKNGPWEKRTRELLEDMLENAGIHT